MYNSCRFYFTACNNNAKTLYKTLRFNLIKEEEL